MYSFFPNDSIIENANAAYECLTSKPIKAIILGLFTLGLIWARLDDDCTLPDQKNTTLLCSNQKSTLLNAQLEKTSALPGQMYEADTMMLGLACFSFTILLYLHLIYNCCSREINAARRYGEARRRDIAESRQAEAASNRRSTEDDQRLSTSNV